MGKRLFALVVIVLLRSVCAAAQDSSRVEVFGGYSYLNADANGLGPRQSGNGWETAVSGSLTRWFGLEGDVSGYYRTYPVDLALVGLPGVVSVQASDYSFLAGPRFNFGPVFVHALAGFDRLSGSALGVSVSQNSFAGAAGGGVEWPRGGRWAVRLSADYALTRHNILLGPAVTQNNFRASAGIVIRLGHVGERATNVPIRPSSPTERRGPSGDAPSLGVTGYPVSAGFMVTSVVGGSPAEQIPLKPGYIIAAIDAHDVRSNRDIEAAIAASATGTVRINFFIPTSAIGLVASERDVKVK